MGVHARPPAFEGSDGLGYTVDILVGETGDRTAPVGAYLLFVRWASPTPTIHGHLESDFLACGTTETEVRAALERLPLLQIKRTLDALIGASR